nr:enoyl-CoA hydratase/isomerase family protein [Halomonas kenyensis]
MAEVEAAIARGKPILFQGATEGRYFCSGFDLATLALLPEKELRRAFADFFRLGRVVFTAPVPVAVLAKGHAIGIGATLLLAADQALIAARAKLRFPETMLGLGLFADMAGVIGHRSTGRLAERMLMQAEPLTGMQAVTCGLADSLAEDSPGHPEDLFTGIAPGPSRLAWAQAKLLCRADVLHVPIEHQLDSFFVHWETSLAADMS